MKAEELAKIMHNEYESEAIKNNWKTQENCRVPFEDLPEENKQTMLAVAKKVLANIASELGEHYRKYEIVFQISSEISTHISCFINQFFSPTEEFTDIIIGYELAKKR